LILEDFVGAVFPCSLETIADEGRGPAEEYSAQAFAAKDGAPGLKVGTVDFRVDLATAFYEVEGRDGRVGGAAGWNGRG
jgi:hypothetical protein